MPKPVSLRYVPHLPDLVPPEQYPDVDRKKVHVRIEMTDEGLEILADSMFPHLLESLLERLDPEEIEAVLCG
jgi:hypothetical protein